MIAILANITLKFKVLVDTSGDGILDYKYFFLKAKFIPENLT